MRPIFLIGYMGSGKTTLGRALAAAMQMRFVDLDEAIEERMHMSVSRIFAERGESGFRALESEALAAEAGGGNVVVACGGGTPCFATNMELMNSRGITVWLDASLPCLHRRLIEGRDKRPLIARLSDDELRDYIVRSLDERRRFYSQANHRFNSDRLESPSEIRESVERFIKEILQ